MRSDILFFAVGIPTEYRLNDTNFFMADGDASAQQLCTELRAKETEFDLFCRTHSGKSLVFIGVRNDFEERGDAIEDAYKIVSGLIDGYALILDEVPQLASVILVREQDSADAYILLYKEGGWAFLKASKAGGAGQWQSRNQFFIQHLLGFFDLVSGAHSIPTELANSLRYALKMYRHGSEAKIFGIEYLCKFSALECLVCGSQTAKKEQLLMERLTDLFENEKVASAVDVRLLWKIRCDASHYARAFQKIEAENGCYLQVYIPQLEQLFAGVVFFVTDHMAKVGTINEVWDYAKVYSVPEIITLHRPPDLGKMGISRLIEDPHLSVKGGGTKFDSIYKQISD